MANKSNPGTVNIDKVIETTVKAGGGVSTKTNPDGSTHITVYSTKQNWHISADKAQDGSYSNVHTDRNNRAYMDYKGGK